MIDVAELLLEAVGIASVSGSERPLAERLVERALPFARDAFVDDAGNAVARFGSGPLHVVFLGHIDTVPGYIEPRIADGWLWGRGAVDAKGPYCSALAAGSALAGDVLERITFTAIGAVEEEAPSSKGARYALHAYPRPDHLVIGEPSGWDAVTLGYKGRLVARLERRKANSHSAGEDTTAADDLVAAYGGVRAWAERVNEGVERQFDVVQVALQEVRTESDGLEQVARATVGFRLPPAWPPERLGEALDALLPETIERSFSGAERPHRAERDTALSRAFRVAIRARGGNPRFKVKTGTSDMNVVAPVWNVPMLAYGPGDSAFDHRPDERVEVRELERAVHVLVDALARLARDSGRARSERPR